MIERAPNLLDCNCLPGAMQQQKCKVALLSSCVYLPRICKKVYKSAPENTWGLILTQYLRVREHNNKGVSPSTARFGLGPQNRADRGARPLLHCLPQLRKRLIGPRDSHDPAVPVLRGVYGPVAIGQLNDPWLILRYFLLSDANSHRVLQMILFRTR